MMDKKYKKAAERLVEEQNSLIEHEFEMGTFPVCETVEEWMLKAATAIGVIHTADMVRLDFENGDPEPLRQTMRMLFACMPTTLSLVAALNAGDKIANVVSKIEARAEEL